MDEKNLFEGEEVITQSGNNVVTLTNQRIRYNDSTFGRAHIVSISLEKLSSIEVKYRSWWILLVIGILSCAFGIFAGANSQGEAMMACLGVGIFLIAIYFGSRKHSIKISSDGGAKISFRTTGMKRGTVLKFVNDVEDAKHKLLLSRQ